MPKHSPPDLSRLEHALERAWNDGSPVAGATIEARSQVAKAAFRRIRSFERRGVSADDRSRQVHDLARGLAARFEQDASLVGPLIVDYEFIAEALLDSIAHEGRDL